MFNQETVARPYAKAAFDFAAQHRSIEQWLKMLTFLAQLVSDNQVKTWISGFLAPEKLANLIIHVCDGRLDQYGQNFINVMAENGRLAVLPEVLTQFIHLNDLYNGIKEVEVTSSTVLSSERQNSIKTAMEKRLSRKVKLHCKIDPAIVAGVIIRAGDMVIDGSVRGRLNRLSDALQT